MIGGEKMPEEFVNTKDVYGSQKTLEKILTSSITEYKDNVITAVAPYSFNAAGITYDNTRMNFKSVDLPNVTEIKHYAFNVLYELRDWNVPKAIIFRDYCMGQVPIHKLTIPSSGGQRASRFVQYHTVHTVDFTADLSTGGTGLTLAENLRYAYNLCHLIVRRNGVMNNTSSNAFQQTGLANGIGWIYVNDDYVNSYKTASNWSVYADQIVKLSDYPKPLVGGTITDTWDQIFAAEEDGTYSTKYSIGDTKIVDICGCPTMMQIVAFDADELSDDSGLAKITWMTYGTQLPCFFNKTNTMNGGYGDSFLRQRMQFLYENTDQSFKSHIKQVKKRYKYNYPTVGESIANDYIWVPSARELCIGAYYESTGCQYSSFFSDNNSRKKSPAFNDPSVVPTAYYIRSVGNNFKAIYITNTGAYLTEDGGAMVHDTVFGFCT